MDVTQRTRFIDHQGHPILLLDYSGIQEKEEALRAIAASRRIIGHQARDSLLTLTYVEGARYDSDVVQALKELTAHNKPYVRAAAVAGMSTVMRVIYRAVTTFSKREIRAFEDLEEAKDWLVGFAADEGSR